MISTHGHCPTMLMASYFADLILFKTILNTILLRSVSRLENDTDLR